MKQKIRTFSDTEMSWFKRTDDEINLCLYCLWYIKSKSKCRSIKRNINRMIAHRTQEGLYCVLIERYLLKDDERFRSYFRLSLSEFDYVLSEINVDVKARKTNFNQHPVSAKQKLCITLRYANCEKVNRVSIAICSALR